MTDNNQKYLDDYLSGKLDQDQLHQLGVSFDAEEFSFQHDVVSGIKEYRKSQLKNRLESVDLSPSFFQYAQSSALVKSFGGIFVASLIGAGILVYGHKVEMDETIIVDLPEDKPFVYEWELIDVNLKNPTELPSVKFDYKPIASKKSQKVSRTAGAEKDGISGQNRKEFVPVVNIPNAISIDDPSPKISDLEKINTVNVSDPDPIVVETENRKDLTIKYKYYDGKLFLSGDFDKAPYEIIEINSSSSRRIYIKYLGKYYKVNVTDKLEDLPEVYDKVLIKELELLKELK